MDAFGKNKNLPITPRAIAAASIVAPFPFILYMVLMPIISSGQANALLAVITFFMCWFFGSVTALAHAITLGLAVALLLKRFKLMNWWAMTLGGYVVGNVIPLWIVVAKPLSEGFDYIDLLFGICGAVGGLTAWYVGRDKAHKISIEV